MVRFLLLAAICCFCALAGTPSDATARVPVLLELFTSEGCSSCPPADELLSRFDRIQPIAGAELIVVSEHVDYWNNLGWIDQNSSQLFSARQNAFALRLHADGVYTPQLVVDGTYPLVGSDRHAAEHAIAAAVRIPKIALSVAAKHLGNQAEVHVSINPAPNEGPADVYICSLSIA